MEDRVPIAPCKKKIVHYHELRDCKVRSRALVWPIDHPAVSVGAHAKKSVVQSFDPLTGVAGTTNTRYEPGQFAQWFESISNNPTELTYAVTIVAPSMPSPLLRRAIDSA
jgi:hypothetical protein